MGLKLEPRDRTLRALQQRSVASVGFRWQVKRLIGRIRQATAFRITCWSALLVTFCYTAPAEHLPTRTYTIADGLPRNTIDSILKDSSGFLWFCSNDGLARFDGVTFTRFSVDQGLPSPRVHCILETRGGDYWVGTAAGVCLFSSARHPAGTGTSPTAGIDPEDLSARRDGSGRSTRLRPFKTFLPGKDDSLQEVVVLYEDREGTIWCGTAGGLFRLEQAGRNVAFHWVDLGMPKADVADICVVSIAEDHNGILWVGTRGSGLYARWQDGRTAHYTSRNGLPSDRIDALLEADDHSFWIGTQRGLVVAAADPRPNERLVTEVYTTKDGLADNWATRLRCVQGHLWVGTARGVSELVIGSTEGRVRFKSYSSAEGLTDVSISALCEDTDGNIWIAASEMGVIKWARRGFTTYSERDGLATSPRTVFPARECGVCVHSIRDRGHSISCFEGERFNSVALNLPPWLKDLGWSWNQSALQTPDGDWWVATGQGLCRFSAVNRIEDLGHKRPIRIYTTADGLQSNGIFRLFLDSRGSVWIATSGWGRNDLARIDPTTGVLHNYSLSPAEVEPALATTSISEDGMGAIWIGFGRVGGLGLARYSRGRFQFFTSADGVPDGWIYSLYPDREGRVWLATSRGGLARIDDPSSDHPHFTTYTTASGLSSNEVYCVVEDRYGRVYAGTASGVDRIELNTGRVRHYNDSDGLTGGIVTTAFRDREENLWFASDRGISRLAPQPDEHEPQPRVLLTQLRVTGDLYPVRYVGEENISNLVLDPGRNDLRIGFVAPAFGSAESIKYQYKLEGAQSDWGEPTSQTSVNYASLSPGSYIFKVRAINAQGVLSPTDATVAFTILPPVWRRPWFLALVLLAVGLAVYAQYRIRLRHLIEVERVRTRIATDLHDDIGASLSRIAILGEALMTQSGVIGREPRLLLSRIAETARGLLEDVADVIWSIEPSHEDLGDLVLRVRDFAADVLEASGIDWNLQAPCDKGGIKLSAEKRRNVYLIIKEAINNAIRHSKCTEISLTIDVRERNLVAEINDNGCGFAGAQRQDSNGSSRRAHGLRNLLDRAAGIRGTCQIDSHPGAGTHIRLTVPLKD